MIESYIQLTQVFFQTSLILVILWFIYRRHIISVFDPLFIYLVTQAFSIELAFLKIQETGYLINFLCCQAAFTVGFLLLASKPVRTVNIESSSLFELKKGEIAVIKLFSLFSFAIIIIGNLYLIKQVGIALLADDPSAAKGANFTGGGGLGLVRRMNWGILYITALSLIFLFLYKGSFKYIVLWLVLVVFLISTGSKGVLIYFISLIPLLGSFADVKQRQYFKALNYFKYFLFAGGVALALFIIVLGRQGSLQDGIFSFGSRLLFFGDAMLYYYDHFSVQYFSRYSLFDFFKEDFNSLLGFFRLADYKRPLGFEMVEYQIMMATDTVFGPNVPYYVKGYIFFGPVGAIMYSLFVGGIVGWVRSLFYKILQKPNSTLIMLLVVHLNLIITTYPQDSNYFMSVLFDTFILAFPIYAIVFVMFVKEHYKQVPKYYKLSAEG